MIAAVMSALWAFAVLVQFGLCYRGFSWRKIGPLRAFEATCMAAFPSVCVYADRYLP
jgi:hypothetical protein